MRKLRCIINLSTFLVLTRSAKNLKKAKRVVAIAYPNSLTKSWSKLRPHMASSSILSYNAVSYLFTLLLKHPSK